MDHYNGGGKNKKERNVIIDNNIITIKRVSHAKDTAYNVNFNKLAKDDELNESIIVFQTVIETIFLSINPKLSFSNFYSLEDYLKKVDLCSYNTVVKFVNSNDSQIDMLITKKKTILSLSLKDIWIVNDKYFIFLGSTIIPNYGVVSFDYQNFIKIDDSLNIKFKNDNFIAPELLATINSISNNEVKLHRNVSNFSLGKIILTMLFGESGKKQLSFEKMNLLMNPIINTKIYFYVLRCIDPDPDMRTNIYI